MLAHHSECLLIYTSFLILYWSNNLGHSRKFQGTQQDFNNTSIIDNKEERWEIQRLYYLSHCALSIWSPGHSFSVEIPLFFVQISFLYHCTTGPLWLHCSWVLFPFKKPCLLYMLLVLFPNQMWLLKDFFSIYCSFLSHHSCKNSRPTASGIKCSRDACSTHTADPASNLPPCSGHWIKKHFLNISLNKFGQKCVKVK